MPQKTAKEIRELNTREPKAWRVIDQFIVERDRKDGKKIPAAVKLEAACFILRRLYPEKTKVEGTGFDSGKQFIIVYPQGMKKEDLHGNVVRETLLPQNIPS